MKVYLVWDCDDAVIAAFISEENAEAYIAKEKAISANAAHHYSVAECEICDWPEHWAAP